MHGYTRMAADRKQLEQQLQALQEQFSSNLPARIAEIQECWQQVQTEPDQLKHYENLVFRAHSLAGSGTSFGYPGITHFCREIEKLTREIKDEIKPDCELSCEKQQMVEMLFGELSAQASIPPKRDKISNLLFKHREHVLDRENVLIYLVDDDKQILEHLSTQLELYQYKHLCFSTGEELLEAVAQQQPHLIILDLFLPDSYGTELIHTIKDRYPDKDIPSIIVSARSDITARLDSIRAGASAFLSKPFDFPILIDLIEQQFHIQNQDHYRVLIIEDSETIANYYAMHLKQANIETMALTNPMQVLTVLPEFNPELILMDLYMPDITGLELAAVIRQHPNYIDIPIVFLSSETDIERQLYAMRSGGDEFITKPIHPEHLLFSVTHRIDRYRSLRALMVRDSLTGLYNHTRLKEYLEIELSRAERSKKSLCFAMLDIDHFKEVNDQYGHPTGDQVLKALSRLLKQRLRKTDIIGRYGGEEFAVIMPDTNAEDAYKVLDELRKGFANFPIRFQEIDVYCSFSCGIATYPEHTTDADISNAADKALYAAKHAGRNRIQLAQEAITSLS